LANGPFDRCVLDLNLAGESGLQLLPELLDMRPDLDILVLTGYGSIATAVEAMRRGAINYLCKPVTVNQLLAGFEPLDGSPDLRNEPPSVEEMEWEHIQRVLNENNGNVSATARALNMHRRTLQRKLQKHSRWR
ncbi:MAG: response regulator, partial [Marinobacter sp.]|nr:response regulator [Marinobacter sp.]